MGNQDFKKINTLAYLFTRFYLFLIKQFSHQIRIQRPKKKTPSFKFYGNPLKY